MNFIGPQMQMLDQEDCLRLHMASRKILRKTGVQVFHDEGFKLLADAGAKVEGNLVKIPPSLVEWAIASAPGLFNLYWRGSDKIALRLDGEGVYFHIPGLEAKIV